MGRLMTVLLKKLLLRYVEVVTLCLAIHTTFAVILQLNFCLSFFIPYPPQTDSTFSASDKVTDHHVNQGNLNPLINSLNGVDLQDYGSTSELISLQNEISEMHSELQKVVASDSDASALNQSHQQGYQSACISGEEGSTTHRRLQASDDLRIVFSFGDDFDFEIGVVDDVYDEREGHHLVRIYSFDNFSSNFHKSLITHSSSYFYQYYNRRVR